MRKVFVGLSGGVDSAVSAYLLKKQGYDVVAAFIKGWEPDFLPCTGKEDRLSAMRVAAHLKIPFVTYDLEEEYKRDVVDYFIAEYQAGRTPNPDVLCNRTIKFGAFWEKAKKDGADFIATGHYAQIVAPSGTQSGRVPAGAMFSVSENREAVSRASANGGERSTRDHYAQLQHAESSQRKAKTSEPPLTTCRLLTSRDTDKDQTYFLWTLTKDDLAHSLFPVGNLGKKDVRGLALKAGLPNATRKDSQGLCFLGHVDMRAFLKRYIPEKQGLIRDTEHNMLGTHDGVWFYTLGEHAPLSGGCKRYYVVGKDIPSNTLIVADTPLSENAKQTYSLENTNWIAGTPHTGRALARYRYRQPLVPVSVSNNTVTFETKELIASGQSCVFYTADGTVLGGAIIG